MFLRALRPAYKFLAPARKRSPVPPVTLVLAVQGELVEEGNLVGEMEAEVEIGRAHV